MHPSLDSYRRNTTFLLASHPFFGKNQKTRLVSVFQIFFFLAFSLYIIFFCVLFRFYCFTFFSAIFVLRVDIQGAATLRKVGKSTVFLFVEQRARWLLWTDSWTSDENGGVAAGEDWHCEKGDEACGRDWIGHWCFSGNVLQPQTQNVHFFLPLFRSFL